MELAATIRILDNGHAPHPYLGSRFVATDGLASSVLDAGLYTRVSGGGQAMETILVTLSSDLEPGQITTIVHNGQVCLCGEEHESPARKRQHASDGLCTILSFIPHRLLAAADCVHVHIHVRRPSKSQSLRTWRLARRSLYWCPGERRSLRR